MFVSIILLSLDFEVLFVFPFPFDKFTCSLAVLFLLGVCSLILLG